MIALNKICMPEIELDPSSQTGAYRINIFPFRDNKTSSVVQSDPESLTIEARKLINKIRSYSNLSDNWDGNGASRPDAASIDAAIEAIKVLDRLNQKIYFIASGPSGEILIELKNENKSIEIFYYGSIIEYAVFHNDECESEGVLDKNDYLSLLKNLYS